MKKTSNSFIILAILLTTGVIAQQNSQAPSRNERLLQLARNYEQTSQYGRALEIYERLWKEEPKSVPYYNGVKQNLLRLKNFSQALSVVNTMLSIQPDFRIEADLGDVLFNMGDKEKAISIWNGILSRDSSNRSVYLVIAAAFINNHMYDEAISVYEEGRIKLNDPKQFLLEIANLHRVRMEHKEAVLLYLEFLKFNPNQYTFIEYNITSFANEEEVAREIEGILLEQLRKDENNLDVRNLLAALYMRTSNYSAALEEFSLIDQYVSTRPKQDLTKVGGELFQFAQNAFNDGAYQHAIQAYTVLLSRYPNSSHVANAKFGLANSYEKLQDYSRAEAGYLEIVQQFERSPFAKRSYYQLGLIQLQHRSNPIEAEKYFREAIKDPPLKPYSDEALLRISECYIQQGDLQKAKLWNQKILNEPRSSAEAKQTAIFMLGQAAYWSGDFEMALQEFSKIQSQPGLASSDPAGVYVNDVLECAMFIGEHKDNPEFLKLFATAGLYDEQKNYQQSRLLYQRIIENDRAKALHDDALMKLGDLELLAQNYTQAISAYQQLIDSFPESYYCDVAQKKIGEVYEYGLKNLDRAQQSYELVLTTYPDSIFLDEIRARIRILDEKKIRPEEN
ncbi:MAG: tetratricopeptide repeat protein [Candidatus Zhuqueibacterota bacterium]